MNIIRLTGKYGILVEPTQYVLVQIKNRKTDGEEYIDSQRRYFKTFSEALDAFGEEYVRDKLSNRSICLSTAIKAIREAKQEVRDVIDRAIEESKDE